MDTIRKRLIYSLFVISVIIGMVFIVIPAGPYWILTGKDLAARYNKWIEEEEKRWR